MCFLISECTLSSQKFSKEGYTVIIIASYYAYKTSLPHLPPPPINPYSKKIADLGFYKYTFIFSRI